MAILYAAILLAVAGLSGSGVYWATSTHWENKALKEKQTLQKQVDDANERAENAATDWEVWQSLQKPKVITITREVQREVQADTDCSARAVPAGLRDALTRASAAANLSVAPEPVPAASAASAGHLGRLGSGLRGLFGGAGGVPEEASGTR